jgi:hypothetical protein
VQHRGQTLPSISFSRNDPLINVAVEGRYAVDTARCVVTPPMYVTLFMEGLLWPESSSEDVRDGDEPADVFRRKRCPSKLVASLVSFMSVQVELGLLGGVSEVGDVVAPKPRPTRTSPTSSDQT